MPEFFTYEIQDTEYEEFARRMIESFEDFDALEARQSWLEYVSDKLSDIPGGVTDGRLTAMADARWSLAERRDEIPIAKVTPFLTRPTQVRYRDTTGLIQKAGTWVALRNVDAYIFALTHPGRRR